MGIHHLDDYLVVVRRVVDWEAEFLVPLRAFTFNLDGELLAPLSAYLEPVSFTAVRVEFRQSVNFVDLHN